MNRGMNIEERAMERNIVTRRIVARTLPDLAEMMRSRG